ncbi:MAG: NAD-dependent epimerase/dehydratase family protein [Opitutales bacterium]|nr:NAD-dependent epimerase/dehydratase family protein [Opitutales bacterium]MBT5812837.1 NAD-dependent epimerase/dehydratase family protein [Opitutales bacterium]MBT6378885.1 NAD-dependent epimerase/dehydratase family protein [Opitutales bacterium]MBT7864883.1 NAD-dependent epimerase/dehydratase family protein [Opitutales bacterium]
MPTADSDSLPPHLSPRKVLVTGASGFLGGHLIQRLLEQGCSVTGLCRRPQPELETLGVEMRYVDLADARAVRNTCADMDTVFHTAARVGIWGKREDFHNANVIGTQSIINGCRDFLVAKLVYTSTPSVVFNNHNIAGADESLPYGTDIPCLYPASKIIAEKAVLTAHGQPPGNLKTVALRPHLIWGPGDPNLVPRVLDRGSKGKLRIVGNGDNRVDLSYIDNVVDAHLCAEAALDRQENNPGGKAYFISNDEPILLWNWIDELLQSHEIDKINKSMSLAKAQKAGRFLENIWSLFRLRGEPPMTRFVASELAKDHWFDISAAKRDLGYAPRISMKEGMRRLLDARSHSTSNQH